MDIYFVTNNIGKIKDIKEQFYCEDVNLKIKKLKIEEIQSKDLKKVAKDKTLKAFTTLRRPLFIEHVGFNINKYEDYPGGLTQIILESIGEAEFCYKYKGLRATAISIIGYCDGKNIYTFEGRLEGVISDIPKGNNGYHWDRIFIPFKNNSEKKTLSELGSSYSFSMRKTAIDKFATYLKKVKLTYTDEMKIPRDLIEKIKEGKVILFIGSGVSATLNLPTWTELVEELAENLKINSDIFKLFGDNLTLAEYYKIEKGSINSIKKWNKLNSTNNINAIKSSKLLSTICSLDFPIIYTTNYDLCIEKAYDVYKGKDSYVKIVNVEDIGKISQGKTQIVKFHGDMETDSSIILTESSYFSRMDFESPLDIKLRYDILGKSILFIGYSLSDINIRYIIYKLNKIWEKSYDKSQKPKSYIFIPFSNPVQEKVLKSRGISTIVGTKLDFDEGLTEFITLLNEEVNKHDK